MKTRRFTWPFLLCCCLFACVSLSGQQYDTDRSVQVWSVVNTSPPSIHLKWDQVKDAKSVDIFRKKPDESLWGRPVARLPGQANEFLDKYVQVGELYEYKISRRQNGEDGFGYILSGIEHHMPHRAGRAILLVAQSIAEPLKAEIDRYILDLQGDGWSVVRQNVPEGYSVKDVKQKIIRLYRQDTRATKALILVGHIPVPYSGNICPDRHGDHAGAWPADAYYADMDGQWTDEEVSINTARQERNHNLIGDQIFDQNTLPSDLELQVGRIDFSDLPAFPQGEIELTRKYFNKNHAFRNRKITVTSKALIANNFHNYDEGFAQNGWKNFSPLVGQEKVVESNYRESLLHDDFLWAYGCGPGSYTTCSGIIGTEDFVNDSLQSVFNMLFGSYFGDWDSQNNLLRASLASGLALTNCWAGRPNWQFHHMGMGTTIGHSVLASQNNRELYATGFAARSVHMALMGDPTLRSYTVAPPKSIQVVNRGNRWLVSWEAPEERVDGYHVFRIRLSDGTIEQLNKELIKYGKAQVFTDDCFEQGRFRYMVRAVQLETTPSGTFWNLSQGEISDDIIKTENDVVEVGFSFTSDGKEVRFINQSRQAEEWEWDFGNGETSYELNPSYKYAVPGNYAVTLKAKNHCFEKQYTKNIEIREHPDPVLTSLAGLTLYPNPSSESLSVHIFSDLERDYQLKVFDLDGQILYESRVDYTGNLTFHRLNIKDFTKGVYIVKVTDDQRNIGSRKFVIN